ncbi:MAG: phospholipase D family protein [Gammaproteobacteria bacterium]|nr:phospholipase D family protein [Gammaproteobacteria bacterium]
MPETTTAELFFKKEMENHPGKSGFYPLRSGENAFRTRNAMTRIAERTIDAQYFIWETDDIGSLMVQQLMVAADRGVRVRLLLDDIHTGGRDFGIASLDSHPNIEVRLFNPFSGRSWIHFEFIVNLTRLNHRMHNKLFLMDDTFAVVGGRNIGDHYFGVSASKNFRDLDLFVVGPVARDIRDSFNQYWDSEWSVPIARVAKRLPTPAQAREKRRCLDERIAAYKRDFPYAVDRTPTEIYTRLEALRDQLIWADAEVLYDDPAKKVGSRGHQAIAARLGEVVAESSDEILLEAAYYIPRDQGIQRLKSVRERGVRVRILTNSMATNDMAPAYAGYRRYRKALLENEVELYELRPDLGTQRDFWSLVASDSTAILHSKIAVFDRKIAFVGSFNFDPRSIEVNTEIGLLIYSTDLAERLIEFLNSGIDPSNSYRVALEKKATGKGSRLAWISEQEGQEVREYKDPQAGFRRRLSAWFISWLPIEDHV